MKKRLSKYFKDFLEIKILDDIMTSYSHAKIQRIFKHDSIRILFEFFIAHNKDHFLSSFKGEQREKYAEALNEFVVKFKKEAN